MADADDPMTTLFADIRHEVAGHIRPAGTAAAAATVKRRRRNRAVAAAVLAVVLVVGPAIGLAWAHNRPDPAPDVADPTPSASASGSTPETTAQSPTVPPSSSAPEPGIPADKLRNTTLTVPKWPGSVDGPCPSGPVKFTDGKVEQDGRTLMQLAGDPVYVDADRDGRNETVIRVDCALQAMFTQVVAYSRGTDARITMLGRVIGTHGEGNNVQKVWKIEAGGTSAVRVDVGDVSPCCSMAADMPQHQWRAYGWDGQKFTQTSGPTSFPPNQKEADLGVTAPAPPVSPVSGGSWTGTLTLTVSNSGPGTGLRPTLDLVFARPVTIAGADAAKCRKNGDTNVTCSLGQIAKGSTAKLTLTVTFAGDPRGTAVDVTVRNPSAQRGEYIDGNWNNNVIKVQIPTG